MGLAARHPMQSVEAASRARNALRRGSDIKTSRAANRSDPYCFRCDRGQKVTRPQPEEPPACPKAVLLAVSSRKGGIPQIPATHRQPTTKADCPSPGIPAAGLRHRGEGTGMRRWGEATGLRRRGGAEPKACPERSGRGPASLCGKSLRISVSLPTTEGARGFNPWKPFHPVLGNQPTRQSRAED